MRYREQNRDKVAAAAARSYQRNRTKRLEMARHNSELTSDRYIKALIAQTLGYKKVDIPDELIIAYRAVLKIKRLLKEKSK